MGLISCTSFCSAAISFWYGVKLIAKENYDGGTVIVVSKTIDAAIFYVQMEVAVFTWKVMLVAMSLNFHHTPKRAGER